MLEKNIIEDLPAEIRNLLILNFLDTKSIIQNLSVSKKWRQFFADPNLWQQKIKKDFAIKQENLSAFAIPKNLKPELFYKNIYPLLLRLQSNYLIMPSYIKSVYHDKNKLLLLVSCCLMDLDAALKKISVEEYHHLLMISLYAGCIDFPLVLLKYNRVEGKYLLKKALRAGNLNLVKQLLDVDNFFNIEIEDEFIDLAARSGKLALVEFLLNPDNQFNLRIDLVTLRNAALSGNLDVVIHLMKSNKNLGLDLILSELLRKGKLESVSLLFNPNGLYKLVPAIQEFKIAVLSGNIEITHYLLDPANGFNFYLTKEILDIAAHSGNFELVCDFLKRDSTLKVDKSTLDDAVRSGNLELVRYLLDSNNKFDLIPDKVTLNCATSSGNLELVRYLLDPYNQFNLKPTNTTLFFAIMSNNLELVRYLLKPNNNFGLFVDNNLNSYQASIKNIGLSQHLLRSDLEIQKALGNLRINFFDFAREQLQKSYDYCSNHFNNLTQNIINNSAKYALNDEAIKFLSKTIADIKNVKASNVNEVEVGIK